MIYWIDFEDKITSGILKILLYEFSKIKNLHKNNEEEYNIDILKYNIVI